MEIVREEIDKLPIFFIVSLPRSGTRLLFAVLRNHSNVLMPFESRFIRKLYPKYHNINYWTENLILDFYKDILKSKLVSNIDIELLKTNLLKLQGETTFGILCKVVYLSANPEHIKGPVKIIGEKNSSYAFYLNKLVEVFPEVKIIHYIRDYKDNIASLKQSDYYPQNIGYYSYQWRRYNQNIKVFKESHPDKYLLIKYEELAKSPETLIAQTFEFLGIEYNFENIKSDINEKFKKLFDKITIGGWQFKVTENEIKIMDYFCSKTAEPYNYHRGNKKTNYALIFITLIKVAIYKLFMKCYKFK
jgi:hypothetical protein